MAYRAVDIGHRPAGAADEVVMVVALSPLEACRAPGRLDAAHEARVGQRAQDVVDRLGGDAAEAPARGDGDVLDGKMVPIPHGGEHGEPRSGDAQPRPPQTQRIKVLGRERRSHNNPV